MDWERGTGFNKWKPQFYPSQIMAAATLPTPPIGAAGSTTSITDNPYVVIADMAYAAWRRLAISCDTRQTRITASSVIGTDTEDITAVAHGLAVNDTIGVEGTVIPTGLAANTKYWVITAADADTITVGASLGGAEITMSAADFTDGAIYKSNFTSLPTTWAALVAANAGLADRWTREISWLYSNPGSTPAELYRAESENAVQLGWRYGALNTTTLLSPYVDYSKFEGATTATPNLRGYESIPAIEQGRYEIIVAMAAANQSRLGEVARRFGVNNGTDSPDPNYNALPLVGDNLFDEVNQTLIPS